MKRNWIPNSLQKCTFGHPSLKSWLKPCCECKCHRDRKLLDGVGVELDILPPPPQSMYNRVICTKGRGTNTHNTIIRSLHICQWEAGRIPPPPPPPNSPMHAGHISCIWHEAFSIKKSFNQPRLSYINVITVVMRMKYYKSQAKFSKVITYPFPPPTEYKYRWLRENSITFYSISLKFWGSSHYIFFCHRQFWQLIIIRLLIYW